MRYLGQGSPRISRNSSARPTKFRAQNAAGAIFFGAPASYYDDLDARDEVALARNLNLPILIMHGGRDYQVIDADIRHWQDGLKGDAKVKLKTSPRSIICSSRVPASRGRPSTALPAMLTAP